MHFVCAKGILSAQNSMNLYRGCTHGCIYCDSRSACYRMDHAFEDVEVKENALQLLEATLQRKKQKCMIATGAMSDPYMPVEKELQLTRGALQLIEKYGFGVTLLTKSDLILRDLPLLQKIHSRTKCVVQMTLTTCEEALCRQIEPNVCTTATRAAVLAEMHAAGIPTVVWLSPILPELNDTQENIRGLLALCRQAGVYGVLCFDMGLTLRTGNREYYYRQLERIAPGLSAVYRARYGTQYWASSPKRVELLQLFHETCQQYGMVHNNEDIFAYLRQFEEKRSAAQISFWDLPRT